MQTVNTKYGRLIGKANNGYTTYFGIPYAAAPVGELRWKAPQPPEKWEGEREAFEFGNRCWQLPQQEHEPPEINYVREFFSDEKFMPTMSEDALYLNIWVPDSAKDKKLPVAFWIHGGAYLHGFGTEKEFDGAGFAKRDVILVTINYRVGAFGFLCHPELSKENPQGISGNYGILDQIEALKWVYENIGDFGGDKHKITVFGQSAGSMSVQTLLSSPLAKSMIKGAILQSAAGYNSGIVRDRTQKEAEEMGLSFAKKLGVTKISEMRALSPEKIMECLEPTIEECAKTSKGLPFIPVIDGYVLPKSYTQTIDDGDIPKIPYMIGSCGDDIGVTPQMREKGEFSQLYYGCINWSLKNIEVSDNPAYVYYFDRKLLGNDDGAFHSSELWYVFETLDRSWRPKDEGDYKLAELMCDYWCNFVKTGNPNAENLPEWKPCLWENHYVKVLDVQK